jgi:hypothetical protein
MWLHLLNIVYGLERTGSQHSGTQALLNGTNKVLRELALSTQDALHEQKLGKMMPQHYHNHLWYKNTPT